MARQDSNINLPEGKLIKKKEVYVEMGEEDDFLRLCEVLYSGANALRLLTTGQKDFMQSEFVKILLNPLRRKDLLRRYNIIIESFPEGQKVFPDAFSIVPPEKGGPYAVRSEIGEFFGGWQKQGEGSKATTTRYEYDNSMSNRALAGETQYVITATGPEFTIFINNIKLLKDLVELIDVEFSKDTYKMKTLLDAPMILEAQKNYLKIIEDSLNNREALTECLPIKIVHGEIIHVETDFTKKNIVNILEKETTEFLNQATSIGNYGEKYFKIQPLIEILNGIIGRNNYVILMSVPIPIGQNGDGVIYSVRSLYMDKLGNIGYGQVETATKYGSTEEQHQRNIAGLAMRQAIIKAFQAFKPLRSGTQERAILDFYQEHSEQRKNKLFDKDRFNLEYGDDFKFKLIAKKDSDIQITEKNFGGLVTHDLYIYEEKIPKRPNLIMENKNDPKKVTKDEYKEEEKEITNEVKVDMKEEEEKEKKEKYMEEE